MSNYEMVMESDTERIERLAPSTCHLHVVARRRRIAGRMIMGEDHGGGIEEERPLQHLARIDRCVVDGALLLHLVGNQVVLAMR
jgi:hypothetical protein